MRQVLIANASYLPNIYILTRFFSFFALKHIILLTRVPVAVLNTTAENQYLLMETKLISITPMTSCFRQSNKNANMRQGPCSSFKKAIVYLPKPDKAPASCQAFSTGITH